MSNCSPLRDVGIITPLHRAVRSKNLGKFEELVWTKADLGARDTDGWTPLMTAVFYKNNKAAEILVKEMTVRDLNTLSITGNNVLHVIALSRNPLPQVMQDISDRCPNLLQQKNSSGDRPIDTARRKLPESQDVYDILERLEQQQQYKAGIADNVETPCNITITVVGHHGVGKSCFVQQLKQEHIPKGGPGSTDTADLYVNYLGYNPNTGFRQTMDGDGEIETGRQRLKRIIDRYRKDANIAEQPSEDKPARYNDEEEWSGSEDLQDDNKEASVYTPGSTILSDMKKTLDLFFSMFKSKVKVRGEVQQEEIPREQTRETFSSSGEDKPKEITPEQSSVIKAIMHTKIDSECT